jgi:hypothetical protein
MKKAYPLDQCGSFIFWPVGNKCPYGALDRTGARALCEIAQKTHAVSIIT